METLETSKTLIVDTVIPKLDQEQTLNGASEFSTSIAVVSASGVLSGEADVVADNNNVVVDKEEEIKNNEVENQVFDAGEFPNSVQGEILVGNGENCWNFGLTETDRLVNAAVVDDTQMKECAVELDSGGNISAALYNDKMESGCELVQEACATVRGVEEVEDEKVVMHEAIEEVEDEKVVMQEAIEEDVIQQNVVDSGDSIEVSTAGISLYVDVFGPVDSLVQGDDSSLVEHALFESSLNDGNSVHLPDDGNKGSIAEVQACSIYKDGEEGSVVEGKVIANHGYRFNVGDLSWVKSNTQLWWPGVICEHSVVGNEAAKTEHDCFQVRLFGSGNVLWGRTSQLKPFNEYFEQMSRQSKSANFHCAVEKAVVEIGRRAKLEMTCPCYLEESKITVVAESGGNMSKEKACKFDELPVLHFEPENLLAHIKCFARDVAVPGTIECKVIQNRLSAFYRSIGHHQLPIHELKPTSDAKSTDQNGASGVISSKQAMKSRKKSSNKDLKDGNDEAVCTVTQSEMKMPSPIISTNSTENKFKHVDHVQVTGGKAEKSYESRERRKSKYLSFPFVDPSVATKNLTKMEESEITDPIDDTSMGSSGTVKSRSKSRKSKCRKLIDHNISVPDAINASTADMLSKLRFTALDCLYPDESKHFDIMQSFFSRFKLFAFRDFTYEVKNKDTVRKDFNHELGLPSTLSEVEIHTEKQMGKKASRERRSTKAATAAPDISKTDVIVSTEKETNINSMPKGRKKKKTTPLGLNIKPTDGFPGNITSTGSIVIDLQMIDPHSSERQTVPMKKKRKANTTPGLPEIKVMAGLSDVKGRGSGAQLEGFCLAGTPNNGKSEPKRKKEATSAAMTNGADLPLENRSIAKVVGLKEVEVTGPYSLHNIPNAGLKEVEVMGPSSLQTMSGLNMEGMKGPASLHLNAELAPRAPDVSKNTEPSSVMQGIQQMGMLSHSGSPELKRKRKQKTTNVTSAIPDLNGNNTESSSQEIQLPEMKCIPPEGKPQRKRKKKTDAGLFDINLSYSETQTNGEDLGTALLLKFAPEAPVPTKEGLISTFCAFGPLKDSETKVLNDAGTAQVVFVNFSDARTAFRSLEKNSPFGPALVNYRLHVLSAASGVPELDGSLNMHQVWPADKVKSPPKPRTTKKPKTPVKPSSTGPQCEGKEAPDLQYVRQNLQMMTSMLENAGDNISPEMRAKLELEIKSLLNKVSSMVDSSSTS